MMEDDEKTSLLASNISDNEDTTHSGNRIVGEEIGVSHSLSQSHNSLGSGFTSVNCQICQAVINLEGRQNQHVVKCQHCAEATPIKSAPPGKKYVRCACNCLLICKATSRRIACPRENCKKVITLNYTGSGPGNYGSSGDAGLNYMPGLGQVRCLCGHCGAPFTFGQPDGEESQAMARCPHCRRVSSLGPSYSRKRAVFYGSASALFLIVLVIVAVCTGKEAVEKQGGLFVLYASLFIASVGFGIRSGMFCCMKISKVESRGPP